MKRKVNLVGPSTLTVSLPTAWTRANNVRKGDELLVQASKEDITYTLPTHLQAKKEITFDTESLNRSFLARYFEMLYINGYDKFTITYSSPTIYGRKREKQQSVRELIVQMSNRFVGLEVVSQDSSKTELRCYVHNQSDDLEKIERRVFFLLRGAMRELLEALAENNIDAHYKEIFNQHDNIVKFITYYLRILHKSSLNEAEKNQLFTLYFTLDNFVDKLCNLSGKLVENGATKKVTTILKEVFVYLDKLFSVLERRELQEEIVGLRYRLTRKIDTTAKLTDKEYQVLVQVRSALDICKNLERAVIIHHIVKQ